MQIEGSRILLTGGSSGIGKATARLLAESGAKVAITGRDIQKLKRVASEINAIPINMDMTNYASFPAKFKNAFDELGGMDVLINNAGVARRASITHLDEKMFMDVFSVNVFGLALLTKEAVLHFKSQNMGHIVNIASTASLKGYANASVYAASKFALRGLTQCWQAELRPHNIRVMQVNPSEVPTALASPNRTERPEEENKLRSREIAHAIHAILTMDDRGFTPEVSIWATNPF